MWKKMKLMFHTKFYLSTFSPPIYWWMLLFKLKCSRKIDLTLLVDAWFGTLEGWFFLVVFCRLLDILEGFPFPFKSTKH